MERRREKGENCKRDEWAKGFKETATDKGCPKAVRAEFELRDSRTGAPGCWPCCYIGCLHCQLRAVQNLELHKQRHNSPFAH